MTKPGSVDLVDAALPTVWTSLIDDSGADIAVSTGEGRLIWVRTPLSWWVSRIAAEDLAGKSLYDVFPKEIAEERIELTRRVVTSGKPVVIMGVWRGVRTRTTIRPLPVKSGHEPLVLIVCRGPVPADRAQAEHRDGADLVQVKFVDPGQLGKLTPRELEILAMIAQGMTTAAIAKKLFRSRKTVEAHRLSMGAKLGVRNRVELARIALESGLLANLPPMSATRGDESRSAM